MPEILVKPETGIDAVADAVARLASLRLEDVERLPLGAENEDKPSSAVVAEMTPQEGLLFLSVVVDGYDWTPSENARLAADLSKFLPAPVYAWVAPDGWNADLAEFEDGIQKRIIEVDDEDD